MQIVLLLWLIALFYVSYYLTGRDFFAPSTMLALSFSFSCVLSIYIMAGLHYSLALETVVLIGSCLTVSLLVGVMAHSAFRKAKITPAEEKATPIPNGFTVFALAVVALVIAAQLNQIRRVAGTHGTFSQIMILFRNRNAYSTDMSAQDSFWLRMLKNFAQALFYVYAFNLMKFFKQMRKRVLFAQILLLALIVLSELLTAGRFSVLVNILALAFLYHMTRIQRMGKYKTYKLGVLVRVTVLVIAAAWAFYAVKEFVGRSSDQNLFDYTAHYMGTGIINLDLYLKKPPAPSNIWGKETFYSLINALRRMGIVDVDYYIFHREFRNINGVSTGNIYTAFRDYHYDFGMAGVIILHFLFSIWFSVFYEYVKKRRSNLHIINLSMMYYCVTLYMYCEYFYTNIIALGFAARLILVWMLYMLLIRKKVKFRFLRRPAYRQRPVQSHERQTI